MEYKEAQKVLFGLAKKLGLKKEEKEAVLTAVGVLDYGILAKNRYKRIIKAQKDKKEKGTQW